MANEIKKLISLEALGTYDELIKQYISDADAVVDAKSIKTVLWDATNEKIKFYKKENAQLATDTADYEVAISSSDVANLKTRVGMDSTLNGYQEKSNVTDIVNVLTGASTVTGSVAKAEADAKAYTDAEIQKLDATPSQEAGTDGLAISLTQVDGKVTAISGSIAAETYDSYGSAKAVQGETTETVKSVDDKVSAINDSTTGLLSQAKKYTDDEIAKLDTTADVTIATETDGVVTLKAGVKEENGIIAQGSGADITLAKVATTGTAADVAIVDEAGKITASNVEAALTEIVGKADTNASDIAKLNGAVTADGSVLKMIHDNAKDAKYGTKTVEGETVEISIEQAIKDAEAAAKEAGVVTVEKQANAETGYAATYYVKQNGVKVGDSINIAKDWLLKTVTIKTCAEADVPEAGYVVGERYFDFEFNTKDSSETTTHVYLKVEEMYDAYTTGSVATDAVVVVVDNDTNKISATLTDGTIARAKIDSTFEGQIAAVETALQKDTDGTYKTVSTRIDEEAAGATYKAAEGEQAKVTISGAISALETKVGTESVADQIKTKVESLDATVTNDAEGNTNPVVVQVVETDGKLSSLSVTTSLAQTSDINALFAPEQA